MFLAYPLKGVREIRGSLDKDLEITLIALDPSANRQVEDAAPVIESRS
jgi:hypothetical protein